MAKVSKKSKRRLIIFGSLSFVGIIYFGFTFVTYIVGYTSLKIEQVKLNESLLELQKQKADLKIEITKLNNPEYVARYAKENYLYSSDGEYVIKIDSSNKKQEEKISNDNKYVYYIISGAVIVLVIIINQHKKSSLRTSKL